MTKTFKVDIRNQLKSVSNGLKNLAILPIALIVVHLLGFTENLFDQEFIAIFLLWTGFWFIPAIILHIAYYSINRNTEFKYDQEKGEIQIKDGNEINTFNKTNIQVLERIYYSDYRHAKWQQNWIPMPWRNYGLIRIRTNNQKEFILTSLMIDIVNPPIIPTMNKYRFIPYPPKSLKQKLNDSEEARLLSRNKIEQFKQEFSRLTVYELKNKTIANGFVKEAEIAAIELLNKK